MKQTVVNRDLIAFFLKPTKETLPAVQQAWDHASDARWGTSYIYTQLDISLRQIGLRKGPSKAIVSHFVGAVQANLVARPSIADCTAGVAEVPAPSEVTETAPVAEPVFQTLTPAVFREVIARPVAPIDALEDAFKQLVAEEEAALLKGIHAKARELARARLLGMVDELEASDA